jgi:hypothetical protein
MPKSIRKIIYAKSMRKRKKERNKYSPYSKRQPSRRERVMFKGVQKYIELGSYKNSTHLHILIKVYDLHHLEVQFLT